MTLQSELKAFTLNDSLSRVKADELISRGEFDMYGGLLVYNDSCGCGVHIRYNRFGYLYYKVCLLDPFNIPEQDAAILRRIRAACDAWLEHRADRLPNKADVDEWRAEDK